MILEDEEAPLSRPFWQIETAMELAVVDQVLRRRFPTVMDTLAVALEAADPMDVVYPGNPNEYSDVVREILVLLSGGGDDLQKMSKDRLGFVIREGLARRFGEPADEARLDDVVQRILSASRVADI